MQQRYNDLTCVTEHIARMGAANSAKKGRTVAGRTVAVATRRAAEATRIILIDWGNRLA